MVLCVIAEHISTKLRIGDLFLKYTVEPLLKDSLN